MAERPQKLPEDEITERCEQLEGWRLEEGKLCQEFKFRDFVRAFGFMTSAALAAEKIDHHPEWSNVYNRVNVKLVTHSADGITELDFELATIMSELATDSC